MGLDLMGLKEAVGEDKDRDIYGIREGEGAYEVVGVGGGDVE